MADEDLRDAVRRARSRGSSSIGSLPSSISTCACCARASVTLRSSAMRSSGVRFVLLHVDGEQLAVKPIRVPPAAGQHLRRRSRAASCRRGSAPACPTTTGCRAAASSFELTIDDIGRQQQRALAQLRQLVRARCAASSASGGASTTTTSSARSMNSCGTVSRLRRAQDALERIPAARRCTRD